MLRFAQGWLDREPFFETQLGHVPVGICGWVGLAGDRGDSLAVGRAVLWHIGLNWAVLIGNTLVYLTIGYALGGRLAIVRRKKAPL